MEITKKYSDGRAVYKFTARKVDYTVIDSGATYGPGAVTIYTARFKRPTPPRVTTMSELLTGNNKTLRGFAEIVTA